MDNKISVLLVPEGKYPKLIKIEDSLEAMQKLVGGCIEEYAPFEDEVVIVCNDEGKINGLPYNRAIYGENKEILDIIAGDFFIAYAPAESDRFLSLPKKFVDKYSKKFRFPEYFILDKDNKVIIPYDPET